MFFDCLELHPSVEFPSWFISLYQTCISCLNNYCNSPLPIPFYSNLYALVDSCSCSLCEQLFAFLHDTNTFQQTFSIPRDQLAHFNGMASKFDPLLTLTKSVTSDGDHQQIQLMKMSKYDEELWRENNLLRSLLTHIPISNESNSSAKSLRFKRFKRSQST